MAEYLIQSETLTAIADAVRSKTGETGLISTEDLATKISGINGCEVVETTIDPDFSDGNIEIVPNDGTAFSKITVQKPDTLISENIAEGVDIAGIIGTLAADGGGSEKVAWGVFKPTTVYPNTITHDLGVAPDIIYIMSTTGAAPVNSSISLFGISQAFSTKSGVGSSNIRVYTSSSYGDIKKYVWNTYIEGTTNSGIYNANNTTFTIAPNVSTSNTYFWLVIGGLT